MAHKLTINGSDNRPDSDYDPEQLKAGIKVEHEHTDDDKIAKIIAKDHLDEFPTYYIELAKMEDALKQEKQEDPTPEDMEEIVDKEQHDLPDDTRILTVKYRSYGKKMKDDQLVKIIAGLGFLGNGGHSFNVDLDQEGDRSIGCYWDGDGPDHIFEIELDGETLEDFGSLFKDK